MYPASGFGAGGSRHLATERPKVLSQYALYTCTSQSKN